MISIAIYDYEWQRKTYLGKVKSFYIKEKRSTYGDYTIWIENDPETNQHIREGNFISFQHYVETNFGRNFIISGESKIGVVKSGNEFQYLNGYNAYPFSSMSTFYMNGANVMLSVEYESLTQIELEGTAKIWLQLAYKENNVQKYLNTPIEMQILSQPNGRCEIGMTMPLNGLDIIGVNVIISGVNGTINLFNAKLEIGDVSTRYTSAPENDFSYTGFDMSVGTIDKIEFTDKSNFTGLIISGKLLEGLIEDRCLYGLFMMKGTPIEVIEQMLIENYINPEDSDRDYEILEIAARPEEDPNEEKIAFQKTGFQIGDSITNIILSRNYGIKVFFDKYRQKLYYYMYKGKDRSRLQNENPHVIFSDANGLLLDPKYLEDYSNYKNVARIAGQGEGADRKFSVVGTAKGRRRKEQYVDARDIALDDENGIPIPEPDYIGLLDQRGDEKIALLQPIRSFEAEISLAEDAYKYGRDFLIGDVVTLQHTTTGIELDAVVEQVHFIGRTDGDEMLIVFGYAPPSIAQLIKSRIT